MKTKTLLLIISIASSHLFAQSRLDDYIQEGLMSNLQLKQENLNYERSMENLNAVRALFFPHVAFNASYTLAAGGRKIQFPIGDLLNPVYTTLNELTESNQFSSVQNENLQFLPNNFHDTKLRVIQPIFNPNIYFGYKARKELVSVQQAQVNAYTNELKYSIAEAYYQFFQAEQALGIFHQTEVFMKALVRLNTSLFENQKVTRDAVSSAEYELSKIHQQIVEAEKNNRNAQSYFNFLLNRDLSTPIAIDSSLLTPNVQYDIEELKDEAQRQRPELEQARRGIIVSESILEMNRANTSLPTLNLVGDIGYQGFEYTFGNDQQYAMLSISLAWDLFKGGEKRAMTQQAQIDYDIAGNKLLQLQKQIEWQVIQSYQEREAAYQAYLTAHAGLTHAERSFQIVRAKYNEGQALLIEYLDAQNRWTTAQLSQSIQLFEWLRAEAALKKTIASL